METNTKSDLLSMYSDMYKEIHGVRPRFLSLEMSVEEIQKRLDGLMEDHKMYMDECRRNDEESLRLYENEIWKLISHGARDEKNAIEWMMQADKITLSNPHEFEMWVYNSGFNCNILHRIKKVLDIK
jgi:hypothetical protein